MRGGLGSAGRGERWWVWVSVAVVAMVLAGCRTAATGEAETAIWDALSPEVRGRIAESVGSTEPLEDPEWWRIVRRTCAVNAFANCVCCAPTAQACNPTNWSCCGSAVFQPADGSSCSTPDPCRCTPPPSAESWFRDDVDDAAVCRAD